MISGDRDVLKAMMVVRSFEEYLAAHPRPGFQLLSTGEEGVAVGLCSVLRRTDQLLVSGRSIGPALARGMDPGVLLAELLGKAAGPCKGKAGRGHVSQPSIGFFGAHAVVAGNLSIAAGVALARQQTGSDDVVVCLFGDGACGAGILYETMNIAALWKLPLVFVCNDNQYSVSTHVSRAIAASPLSELAKPFGIPSCTVDGMDVLAVRAAAEEAVARARTGGGPSFVEAVSYRFVKHSTWSKESRPLDEIEEWKLRCPIASFAKRCGLDPADLRPEVDEIVALAARFAEESPFPSPEDALADVD